jgi:antitoxin ParD1/3/4
MARPITSADFPPDLARFAEAQVAAGRFASVQDVCEAGVEALRKHEAKLAFIEDALEEGERSGTFEGDPFASVRAELGLPPRR